VSCIALQKKLKTCTVLQGQAKSVIANLLKQGQPGKNKTTFLKKS